MLCVAQLLHLPYSFIHNYFPAAVPSLFQSAATLYVAQISTYQREEHGGGAYLLVNLNPVPETIRFWGFSEYLRLYIRGI